MVCSVISDNINIVVDTASPSTAPLTGSALQNPDISRVTLGALLRRNPTGNSTRRTFWSSFKTFQIDSHANSNQ